MEVEFSFVGLDLAGWFLLLQKTLTEAAPDIAVDQIMPPPGAFGAVSFAKVKASLASVAGLATIIEAGASLYSAASPRLTTCEISVQTGQVKTLMTYECEKGNPTQLVEAVSNLVTESLQSHIDRHGHPQRVIIRPVR